MELAELIIRITEYIGTVAFAISGVIVAINKRLDFFGAAVLGVTTAVGGGALRDILLGITPPMMFQNYVFVAVALAISCLIFIIEYHIGGIFSKGRDYLQVINIFDAVGLGAFTVVGVNTAIISGYSDNGFLVIFVGTITGIGGGVLRDVLAGRIPMVLRKQIYAVAAIVGAAFNFILYHMGYNPTLAMLLGAAAVMLIRFLASYFKWDLPKVSFKHVKHGDGSGV